MAKPETVTIDLAAAQALCTRAAARHGANPEMAVAIATAAVRAEADGQPSVGLSHFIDYLDALDAGRIDGSATPVITRPAPAVFLSDARWGVAHTGFDQALPGLIATARGVGLAMFVQRDAFTCGSLGQFVIRLAEAGLIGLAATNGPALLAGSGGTKPVYCTNPMAFAAPTVRGAPLLIDQSSSATAFVNIRRAAQDGRSIPEGWAVDDQGKPTTDPAKAMGGALLAFGGGRGANIALMVEVLAAGLSGANWSTDAPSIVEGNSSPATGLFVLAIDPTVIDVGFKTRLGAHLKRLSREYHVHIPGKAKAKAAKQAEEQGVTIPKAVYDRIAAGE
jgi:(2R)-3-sulfolactate dehydrogenase (NADP+)